MTPSHIAFFERADALPLKEALMNSDLLPQYELLSRLEIPAVQAAVWAIEPIIETLDPDVRHPAIEAAEALIGEHLMSRGFRVILDARGKAFRGHVQKARFIKTGTIWELPDVPETDFHDEVGRITDQIIVQYRSTLTELAK